MNGLTPTKYAFILGRERELCLAELRAVLRRFCFDFDDLIVSDNVVTINLTQEPEEVAALADVLGGVIKIFRIVDSFSSVISTPSSVILSETKDLPAAILGDSSPEPQNDNKVRTATQRVPLGARDDNYVEVIAKWIKENKYSSGKVTFALSAYPASHLNMTERSLNTLGFKVKKELRKLDISSRFLELREGTELPTILSLKEKMTTKGVEFALLPAGLGVLIGLSNPEEWSKRDYDKPAQDKKSGMLPPKLARMMINLALGENFKNQRPTLNQTSTFNIQHQEQKTESDVDNSVIEDSFKIKNLKLKIPQHEVLVVDPFCGSGNIVLEALMLGCDVVASDISEKAVADTKKNVEWLGNQHQTNVILSETKNPSAGSGQVLQRSFITTQGVPFGVQDDKKRVDIFQADAADPSLIENLKLKIENCDRVAIVCEPYLGEPKRFKPTLAAARGEYANVKELYLKFFMNFITLKTLKLPVTFCLVFPLVETIEGKRFSLWEESVDEIRKIGYTTEAFPLVYGRDYQVVKRQIVLLKF